MSLDYLSRTSVYAMNKHMHQFFLLFFFHKVIYHVIHYAKETSLRQHIKLSVVLWLTNWIQIIMGKSLNLKLTFIWKQLSCSKANFPYFQMKMNIIQYIAAWERLLLTIVPQNNAALQLANLHNCLSHTYLFQHFSSRPNKETSKTQFK